MSEPPRQWHSWHGNRAAGPSCPWPLMTSSFSLSSPFLRNRFSRNQQCHADVHKSNGDLQHRGHVVAIALMCRWTPLPRMDTENITFPISSKRTSAPTTTRCGSDYELYRCSLVHSWNLFEAAICPDDTKIKLEGRSLTIGLLDLFDCLVPATEDFLEKLTYDPALQKNTLERYEECETPRDLRAAGGP